MPASLLPVKQQAQSEQYVVNPTWLRRRIRLSSTQQQTAAATYPRTGRPEFKFRIKLFLPASSLSYQPQSGYEPTTKAQDKQYVVNSIQPIAGHIARHAAMTLVNNQSPLIH